MIMLCQGDIRFRFGKKAQACKVSLSVTAQYKAPGRRRQDVDMVFACRPISAFGMKEQTEIGKRGLRILLLGS